MNEDQIENLLRKTPCLKIPDGLEEKLRQDIRLPRAEMVQTVESGIWFRLKRWMPVAACLAFALTALAVQIKTLSRLKMENAALRSATQGLEQLRRDNAGYKRLLLASEDIEGLRKDNAERVRLREEAMELQAEAATLVKLRAENKALETSLALSATATNDFFADARARGERTACVNNLKQIGLAARLWDHDHEDEDIHPSDFISMKNEMGTPKIMKCPTDTARAELTWADVAAGNVSYQMAAPGIKMNETLESVSVVFVVCPIHHNYCLADGSVHQLSEEEVKQRLKVINGRKVLQ